MQTFLDKHASSIIGVLSGFDRIIFRGYLRQLSYVEGLQTFLSCKRVLLKDFGRYCNGITERLKISSLQRAEDKGRPVIYLSSSSVSKEQIAQKIAKEDGIDSGLICILKAVEPCRSFDIFKNRTKKKLELVARNRKCLFLYHYFMHPIFGFMHVRIQTWLPFNIQVYINGREWLSREMMKAEMAFDKRDNCFPTIDNIERAQRFMNKQTTIDWDHRLSLLAKHINPVHSQIFGEFNADYFWSAFQTEWASDVMFKSQRALDKIYPQLLHHGMMTFNSPDVMRFLGKKLTDSNTINGNFAQQVTSDVKIRAEGARIKFRAGGNSVKSYNKQGSLLRIETTINAPEEFKVSRPKEGGDQRKRHLLPMRRGISDLERRAEVSQQCNDRFLNAQAQLNIKEPMDRLIDNLCQPTVDNNGRRVRALNPWGKDDFQILSAINRGDFLINGFRNKDLRQILFGESKNKKEQRKQSSKVTRLFRILKSHGLIKKIPKSHRYQITQLGRRAIPAIIAARKADVDLLCQLAA